MNESLSQCPPALPRRLLKESSKLNVAFYQAKENTRSSSDIENVSAFFLVLFYGLNYHSKMKHSIKSLAIPKNTVSDNSEKVLITFFGVQRKICDGG